MSASPDPRAWLKARLSVEAERYAQSVAAKHKAIGECLDAFAALKTRTEILARARIDWDLSTPACAESPTGQHVFPLEPHPKCLFCDAPPQPKRAL